MNNQTAMQYVLSLVEQMYSKAPTLEVESAMNDIINIITQEGLPMEREQLKEMYLNGIENYDPTFKRKSQWTSVNATPTGVEWWWKNNNL